MEQTVEEKRKPETWYFRERWKFPSLEKPWTSQDIEHLWDDLLDPWYLNRCWDIAKLNTNLWKKEAKERERKNLLKRTIEHQKNLLSLIYEYKSLRRQMKTSKIKERNP